MTSPAATGVAAEPVKASIAVGASADSSVALPRGAPARGRRTVSSSARESSATASAPAVAAGRTRAEAGAYTGRSGTDWVFAGSMRFPNDVLALFDCGTSLPDRDELELIGTEGSLFLDDPWHGRVPVIELRRDGRDVERIELEPVDAYRLEVENLADAAAGEAPLLLGREDAVAQARALEALHRSAETGAPVSLD